MELRRLARKMVRLLEFSTKCTSPKYSGKCAQIDLIQAWRLPCIFFYLLGPFLNVEWCLVEIRKQFVSGIQWKAKNMSAGYGNFPGQCFLS